MQSKMRLGTVGGSAGGEMVGVLKSFATMSRDDSDDDDDAVGKGYKKCCGVNRR